MTRALLALLVAAYFVLSAPTFAAQSFATKPVRLIVPYAPGGGADLIARIVQPKLVELLGQQVIVDNRAGASGNIGAEVAAKTTPNGYTLFMATANLTMAVSQFHNLPFDPIRDFSAVSLLAKAPSIVAVNPSLPAATMSHLIALAKSAPGKLNYASDGGGPLQMFVELLKITAKIDVTNVPYSSTGPAVLSVMSGEASIVVAPAIAVIPHAKSGRLRALAITSGRRLDVLPDLPTVSESGVPGFEANQWYGILVPATTPAAIVRELSDYCAKVMQDADVNSRLTKDASITIGNGPREFSEFLKEDIAKWALASKSSGVRH